MFSSKQLKTPGSTPITKGVPDLDPNSDSARETDETIAPGAPFVSPDPRGPLMQAVTITLAIGEVRSYNFPVRPDWVYFHFPRAFAGSGVQVGYQGPVFDILQRSWFVLPMGQGKVVSFRNNDGAAVTFQMLGGRGPYMPGAGILV